MKIKSINKKRKKENKNSKNNIIYPKKHDKIGNLNFYSEEIVKSIVDKIISLTFTKLYTKNLEKKLSDYNIEYFIKSTNFLLELCNINHDIDDKKLNLRLKFSKNFTSPYVEKINFNQKITDNNINESMENIVNVNNDIDKPDKIQYSIKIDKYNFWGMVTEPKPINVDRTCNNKNKLKKEKNNKTINEEISFIKNNNKKIKTKMSLFQLQKLNKSIEDKISIIKKVNINDFPYENIPKEEFERQNETEEIKQIRKCFLEEQKKINMEKEAKNKKFKKNIIELDTIIGKNESNIRKEKKPKKGNIHLIKVINPDTLVKEFNPVFWVQKEIKPGSSLSNVNEEISKLQIEANKNIEYNLVKEIKKDIVKKIIKPKSIKKEYQQNKQNEISMRLKPSGSNFSLIRPAIGVKIKEESNIKSGGVNFYQKYKKFSIYDFNKTLRVTKDIENKKTKKKQKQNDIFNKTTTISDFSNIKENEDIKGIKEINTHKIKEIKEEDKNKVDSKDIYEKKLRKTFYHKLNYIKIKEKKIYKYKSKSGISLINFSMRNNNSLKDFLTSEEVNEKEKEKESNIQNSSNYFYYNNYNNEYGNNYLDMTNNNDYNYKVNAGKMTDRIIYSPIPTKGIKLHNNSFLKGNKIYNVMDNFNRKIVNGEYMNDFDINKKGILLPKINLKKNRNKSEFYMTIFDGNKYNLFRERKKKILVLDDDTKLNSSFL